jgi:hypothetical protein
VRGFDLPAIQIQQHAVLITVQCIWCFLFRYVAADCDAVTIMRNSQFYRPTPEDTVATSLKAGKHRHVLPGLLDHPLFLCFISYLGTISRTGHRLPPLRPAVRHVRAPERKAGAAGHRQGRQEPLATRVRLGHFDGDPKANVYGGLGAAHICTARASRWTASSSSRTPRVRSRSARAPSPPLPSSATTPTTSWRSSATTGARHASRRCLSRGSSGTSRTSGSSPAATRRRATPPRRTRRRRSCGPCTTCSCSWG